jgi:hypothetical protein
MWYAAALEKETHPLVQWMDGYIRKTGILIGSSTARVSGVAETYKAMVLDVFDSSGHIVSLETWRVSLVPSDD